MRRRLYPKIETLDGRILLTLSLQPGYGISSYTGVGFSLNPVTEIIGSFNGQADDNPTDYQVQVDWGDGNSSDTKASLVARGIIGTSGYVLVKGSHIYKQAGTYNIIVSATGPDGETMTEQTATATVVPMPDAASQPITVPTAYKGTQSLGYDILSLQPGYGISSYTGVGFSLNPVTEIIGSFNGQADDDVADYHAQINWGDSNTWDTAASLVTRGIIGTSGYVLVKGSHVYKQAGTYNVVVYITGPDGQTISDETATATVSPNPNAITLGDLSPAQWTANQPGYDGTISVTGGSGGYQNLQVSGLPSGLSATVLGSTINGQQSGTISISGTPTQTGTFTLTTSLQDGNGDTGTGTESLTINAAPLSVGGLSPSQWTVNQPGYDGTITVTGGSGGYQNLQVSGLPPGLSATILSSTINGQQSGIITIIGTPTRSGTFALTTTLEDGNGATGNGTETLTINTVPQPIAIEAESIGGGPNVAIGTLSASLAASGAESGTFTLNEAYRSLMSDANGTEFRFFQVITYDDEPVTWHSTLITPAGTPNNTGDAVDTPSGGWDYEASTGGDDRSPFYESDTANNPSTGLPYASPGLSYPSLHSPDGVNPGTMTTNDRPNLNSPNHKTLFATFVTYETPTDLSARVVDVLGGYIWGIQTDAAGRTSPVAPTYVPGSAISAAMLQQFQAALNRSGFTGWTIEYNNQVIPNSAPVPTPPSPTLLPADSNGSSGAETTTSPNPYLIGTTIAGATVQLLNSNGTVVNKAQANSSGEYQIAVPGPLSVGSYQYRVAIVASDGRVSSPSAPQTITVVPPLPLPLVTMTTVREVMNKKHQVTEVIVIFSGAVNPGEANETGIYRLATAGRKGSYTAKNAGVIKLRSAVYTQSGNKVALTPKRPFALTKPVQLEVFGAPPSGLQDSYGRYIDGTAKGSSGSNAVAVLSGRGVSIESLTWANASRLRVLVTNVVGSSPIRDTLVGRKQDGHPASPSFR